MTEATSAEPKADIKLDDSEGTDPPKEKDSIEITRDGKESRPELDSKTKMISDRINQVKERTLKEKDRADLAEDKNTRLEAELKVFQANQKLSSAEKPDINDFEEGALDPDYIKKSEKYEDDKDERRWEARVKKANEVRNQETRADARDQSRKEHYKRSIELGARDFNETEDRCMENFGKDNTQDVIASFRKSEVMIYYLGKEKNKQEAQDLRALIKRDNVAGIFALGELSQSLRIPSHSKDAPDPDLPLDGATPPKNRKRGPKGATYE